MQSCSIIISRGPIVSLLAILLFALSVVSCRDDREGEDVGCPAQMTLSFCLGDFPQENILRSSLPAADENKVHNLYVFVFGSDGLVRARKYCPYDAANDKPSGLDAANTFTIQTLSGVKDICMIANIDDKAPLANITKAQLDAITTKTELANLIVSYKSGIETLQRTDGKLLMSGQKSYEVKSGQTNQVSVPLRRLCSKVQFAIVSGNANLKFTPTSWRVMRVPRKVRLLASDTDLDGGVRDDADFFNSTPRTFESGSSFVFYQYGNRKPPKKLIAELDPTKAFNLREKQVKIPGVAGAVSNGAFEYADDNATYVLIEGDILITETSGVQTQARVRYAIHLGYVDQNANDYDCKRNTFYNYTVTINGVNSIKVESQATSADVEPHPGAEGSVIRATKSFSFDSHYATCVIKVPRTVANSPLPFYVNTPFELRGTTDINWIKFVKNPTATPNAIALYPGQNSSTLLNPSQMIQRIKDAIATNEMGFFINEGGVEYAYFTVFINEYYYDKDPMNPAAVADPTLWKKFVNQPPREFVMPLIYSLSKDGKSTFADVAYIISQESIKTTYSFNSQTAVGFEVMDENWGETYTTNDAGATSRGNNDALDGWKNSCLDWDLVTGDPRTASWGTGVANRRWDNFVDLRSIVSENVYGWGTYRLVSNGTTLPKPATMTTNKARYACLARNRDLDGNGYIDRNEVRWYLAAFEQLVNIWIGSIIIEQDDQMYRTPEFYSALGRPLYVLYFTSTTYDNTRNNPSMLWSKEGTSMSGIVGPAGGGWFPGGYNLGYDKFYTRCVRNLGSSDPSVPAGTTVSWDAGTRVISLVAPAQTSWIHPDNFRSTNTDLITGELPPHTERSPENMPASKFQVAKNLLNNGATYSWVALRGSTTPAVSCKKDYYEATDASDKGSWRMPNQRELQLMSRRDVIVPSTNLNVWSATSYTYSLALDAGNRDRALWGNDKFLSATDKGSLGQVRCVRDMK